MIVILCMVIACTWNVNVMIVILCMVIACTWNVNVMIVILCMVIACKCSLRRYVIRFYSPVLYSLVRSPKDPTTWLIKRVVALEGDQV
ncbi:hypothetical protein BgiMline_012201, partial [Biomphalaria glabrata]